MRPSRRELLVLAGAGLAQAGLAGCSGPAEPNGDLGASDLAGADLTPGPDMAGPCADGIINAGPAADVPLDGAVATSCGRVYLCRDAGGLYALTTICTHAQCDVVFDASQQFACPCHGSVFDFNGAVVNGPALRPLAHFELTVDAEGNAIVNTNNKVSASTRTAG